MSCNDNVLQFKKLLKIAEPKHSGKREKGTEEKLFFKSPHFKLVLQENIFFRFVFLKNIFIKLHEKNKILKLNLVKVSIGPNYHTRPGGTSLENSVKSTLSLCLWGLISGGIRIILPQAAPGLHYFCILFLAHNFMGVRDELRMRHNVSSTSISALTTGKMPCQVLKCSKKFSLCHSRV